MKNLSFSSLLIALFLPALLSGSHIRCGDIRYERVAPLTEWRYKITVTKYLNQGSADRCEDTVYFGDGSKGLALRSNGPDCEWCEGDTRCGEVIPGGLTINIFTVTHTYVTPGQYTIASVDLYRTSGYSNIYSFNHPFYITAFLVIEPGFFNAHSAHIDHHPILFPGITCFSHTPVVSEQEGDSLVYEVSACLGAGGQPIPDYFFPGAGPGGTFGFQGQTLVWCTPEAQGLYAVSYRVKEYRRDNTNTMRLIGWVQRDQDAIVYDGPLSLNRNDPETGISLFPQPVKDRLYLQRKGNGEASITIHDLRGLMMLSLDGLTGEEIRVDLDHLAPGVYLMQVNEGGKRTQRRLIKE